MPDRDKFSKKIQGVFGWIGLIIFGAGLSAVLFRLDYRGGSILPEIPMSVTFFGALGVIAVGVTIVAVATFIINRIHRR